MTCPRGGRESPKKTNCGKYWFLFFTFFFNVGLSAKLRKFVESCWKLWKSVLRVIFRNFPRFCRKSSFQQKLICSTICFFYRPTICFVNRGRQTRKDFNLTDLILELAFLYVLIFVIFAPQTRLLGKFLLHTKVHNQRKSQQDSIRCKFVMWSNYQ